MAQLVDCRVEQSSYNQNASCVVCYYHGKPIREQVVEDLEAHKGVLGLSCDTRDPSFSYEELPTNVSKRAGLHRYECDPCG